MGEFFISDMVMIDIAKGVAREVEGVAGVMRVDENTEPDNLMIDVAIAIRDGSEIWDTAISYQERLAEIVESMTAFNVVKVNVEVRGIV